jgi:hypothetical protein
VLCLEGGSLAFCDDCVFRRRSVVRHDMFVRHRGGVRGSAAEDEGDV